MKFIVGLGNPGKKYEFTRHNIGFLIVDALADAPVGGEEVFRKGLQSRYCKQRLEGESVVLVKPQTFMNLSGKAVQAVLTYFKGPPEDLLVVHDDVDLEPGQLRFRAQGSSGGHRGIESIIECLGRRDFHRLKFGVGRDERRDTADFVLTDFDRENEEKLKKDIERAAAAVKSWVRDGLETSAAVFNSKPDQNRSDKKSSKTTSSKKTKTSSQRTSSQKTPPKKSSPAANSRSHDRSENGVALNNDRTGGIDTNDPAER